jgi:predicted ribosomally synthesized peptide with SipW-like signal peptide
MAKKQKQPKEPKAQKQKQQKQQLAMKMPGGRRARSGGPDVYTGLLFLAVLVLGAATTLMYFAAVEVSPESNPLALQQEGQIKLPNLKD